MANLLKGAPVSAALKNKLIAQCETLAAQDIVPTLAIVRVGERPDDISYENSAVKRIESIGAAVQKTILPADASESDLNKVLLALNDDNAVHGVLLLRPLPKTMDENRLRNVLCPAKDLDGITDLSLAGVFTGQPTGHPPCTAQACMEILQHYAIDLKGKQAVVVGRSLVVGKPLAMMLLAQHATVTVCHTRTQNLPQLCREADIIIACAGSRAMISAQHVKPGQVVLDVGIHVDEAGNLCGDVDFTAVEPIVEAITPVPGGVGGVTTSVLAKHLVLAAASV